MYQWVMCSELVIHKGTLIALASEYLGIADAQQGPPAAGGDDIITLPELLRETGTGLASLKGGKRG